MTQTAKKKEIEKNLEVFNKQLPALINNHGGKYALLRKKEIIGIYDTASDAQMTGQIFYEDDLFSIQKISVKPVDLGCFSHAVHLG